MLVLRFQKKVYTEKTLTNANRKPNEKKHQQQQQQP